MRWVENVARIWGREMRHKLSWKNWREENTWET